ncbi:MAG: hypothetical protein M0Z46_01725 [Actinomycetota bacterium]|nr:hypothetical protein [Actinomycetota bacterium]
MTRRFVLRASSAVVIVALAIAGYVVFVPVHRPDPRELASLAIASPVAGLRAHPKTSVRSASGVPLAAVKKAAASTPGETGAYVVQWRGAAPVTSGSVEVIAVPTARLARSVKKEAVAAELSRTSLTSSGYGYGGTTSVPGVPGAEAAYYLKGTTPTITAATPRATVAVFRAGRVVLEVRAESKGDSATTVARALATAEHRHLDRMRRDLVLAETRFPVVASAVYVLVALGVLAVVLAAPGFVVALERRRHDARTAAERRARVARGSKVVKRHAPRGYAAQVEARSRRR